jgi:flagellar biosynthesis GTPase FlhF
MSETMTAEAGPRTYRGETIESLLPRIRAELGPDAVIVRQREGLIGGVGGFFQKRCVEVEARPGRPRVDLYDELPDLFEERERGEDPPRPAIDDAPDAALEDAPDPRVLSRDPKGGAAGEDALDPPSDPAPPARDTVVAHEHLVRNDAATREGMATPAVQELVDQAQPFADLLRQADGPKSPIQDDKSARREVGDDKSARRWAGPAAPARARARARATTLLEAMVARGLGEDIAGEIVDAVVANALPLASAGKLRTLVRNELALRLPVAPLPAPGQRTIVMVGPAGAGKSAAIEAIAAAHAAAGTRVDRHSLEALPARGLASDGLLLVDTPPLWGGADGLTEAARQLGRLPEAEVHLVLRAGTAAAAGIELVEGLAALRPNRLLIAGAGETSHLGGVLDVALRAGVPLGYVAESSRAIALADPRELARRVTP